MSANTPPGKPANTKEETGRKTGSTKGQEQALKCPRCDSPNTKFCYYNNYSLSQPRHFCKTCRRYWTKGGALRNVPIGGGCRKKQKMKSTSRFSAESKDATSSSDMGGFNFFHGLSPAVDFQLGGLSLPRLNPSPVQPNMYHQFGDALNLDPSGSGTSTMGLANYSLYSTSTSLGGDGGGAIQVQENMNMGSMNVNSNLASSIESLSSINQDLHWKLQQQRLATLYVGEHQKESTTTAPSVSFENQALKPQPILFQNLEVSKPEITAVGNQRKGSDNETATEWFFGNSYAPTPTTSGNDNTSNWNGIQAWSDLHQCSNMP